jgi:hypothetical protein
MSDLFTKIIRFDDDETNPAQVLYTNQLGIYQLDRELQSNY